MEKRLYCLRRPRHPLLYVEDLNDDVRTPLATFFSTLLNTA